MENNTIVLQINGVTYRLVRDENVNCNQKCALSQLCLRNPNDDVICGCFITTGLVEPGTYHFEELL